MYLLQKLSKYGYYQIWRELWRGLQEHPIYVQWKDHKTKFFKDINAIIT